MAEEIKLSAEAEEKLIKELDRQIELGEDFRSTSDWEALHESYWRMHFAEPNTEVKNSPWPGASNLVLPMTHVIDYSIVANEFDAMLANDPVIQVNPTEDAEPDTAEILSRYYDWWLRNVWPIRVWGSDWLLENTVDGTCCAKTRMNRDFVVKREDEIYEELDPDADQEDGMPPKTRLASRETTRIERVEEVTVEAVDLSRIYMAPDSGPTLQWPDCRFYWQDQHLTWDDMLERRKHGYKVDDDLKAHLEEREVGDVEKLKKEREGISTTTVEPTIRITEHYCRWPLAGTYQNRWEEAEAKETNQTDGDEEGYAEEVIATYCPDARKLLRVVPLQRIYPDNKRPHILNHYTRTPRYPYGVGVPSKMRHIQRAASTIWNQGIDSATLANLPYFFFSPIAMGGDMPDLLGVSPGQGIPVLDPRGINYPQFRFDWQLWNSQNMALQSWAERVGAVSDVQLGRNPSTPNAPRTARGMAMQIQQGNLAFSWQVSVHREAFIDILRRVHSLKSKYAPQETRFLMKSRATSRLERLRIRKSAFEIPVEFEMVLNPNRQGEQQTVMQLTQLLAAVPFVQQNEKGVRELYRQAYNKVGPASKVPFDRIWPEPAPIQVVPMQPGRAPEAGPKGPAGPPMPPGAPAMAQQQMMLQQPPEGGIA